MERGAWDYIRKIDAMGGMVAAIEQGYPQREIAEASYRYQMAVDSKEKIIVGVNDFVTKKSPSTSCRSMKPWPTASTLACKNSAPIAPPPKSTAASAPSAKPPRARDNLMPFIYDAVKAYATLGEICEAMRAVFGAYEEVAVT